MICEEHETKLYVRNYQFFLIQWLESERFGNLWYGSVGIVCFDEASWTLVFFPNSYMRHIDGNISHAHMVECIVSNGAACQFIHQCRRRRYNHKVISGSHENIDDVRDAFSSTPPWASSLQHISKGLHQFLWLCKHQFQGYRYFTQLLNNGCLHRHTVDLHIVTEACTKQTTWAPDMELLPQVSFWLLLTIPLSKFQKAM